MSKFEIGRPDASEHASYYSQYIDLVPGGDVVAVLESQLEAVQSLFNGMTDEQATYRYADGKWSIKELLGHITDCERIFSYRTLRFARNDQTPIEGFEQDGYAESAGHNNFKLRDLIDEFSHIRQSTLYLLRGFDEAAWQRRGLANNNEISVRALAYCMAGHQIHHINVLKDKYLTK